VYIIYDFMNRFTTGVRVSLSTSDAEVNSRYLGALKNELSRLKELRSPHLNSDKRSLAREMLANQNAGSVTIIPQVYNDLTSGIVPMVTDENVLTVTRFRLDVDGNYRCHDHARLKYCRLVNGTIVFDSPVSLVPYEVKKPKHGFVIDFFRAKCPPTGLAELVPLIDVQLAAYFNPTETVVADMGKKALRAEYSGSFSAKSFKAAKIAGILVSSIAPVIATLGNMRLAIGVMMTGLCVSAWGYVRDHFSTREINSLPNSSLIAKGTEVLDSRISDLTTKIEALEPLVASFEEVFNSGKPSISANCRS
jgi:hypothetical protein